MWPAPSKAKTNFAVGLPCSTRHVTDVFGITTRDDKTADERGRGGAALGQRGCRAVQGSGQGILPRVQRQHAYDWFFKALVYLVEIEAGRIFRAGPVIFEELSQ